METSLTGRHGLARSRGKVSAFTLIELIISSGLMSVLLVGAYMCLSAGISGQKLVEARADVAQKARVALALISADLRSACPLSKDVEFSGVQRVIGKVQADNIDFGTHNYFPKAPHESDFCEVSYFVDMNRETGNFSLWRRRDSSPDPEPLAGGTREEVAENVLGVRFEYYDGFKWYDDWGDPDKQRRAETSRLEHPNLFGLPEAVRITLSFSPESAKKKKQASEPEEEPENPPEAVVYQTVVRLNLAGSAAQTDSTSSSTPAAPTAPGQPGAEGAPGGFP
jgi:hypothetical protein